MNVKKVFLILLVMSLVVSAVTAIIIFLVGKFGETESKLLLTTLTVAGYSLTGLCASALFDSQKYRAFAVFGILVSIVSFIFTINLIWSFVEIDYRYLWKILITLITLSIASAHSSLILLIKSEKTIVNLSVATTVFFIAIVSGMVIYPTLIELNLGDMYWRLLGVFAVLDALGTVTSPILKKVYS